MAATIGDRTWETVQRQCGLDVLRATTAAGLPTHLASTTSGCGAATVRRSTPRLPRLPERYSPWSVARAATAVRGPVQSATCGWFGRDATGYERRET
ncbi:hypothetical protein [Streptomyces sp. SD31]|uniref:hypothetical protein n=1 Tax=Streptomyces sp. SD31 TaxID=3452208 RepID=UPI003F8B2528